MMEKLVTKDDLKAFRLQLIKDMEIIFKAYQNPSPDVQNFEWLRSKTIRQILHISPATLQNLRVSGKIRSRKLMGSYYYNKNDLLQLFKEEN